MSKEQEEMQQATEEHIEQPLPDEPKEEQSEPMGILTSRAHEDMTLAILQVQAPMDCSIFNRSDCNGSTCGYQGLCK